jgi:hypothetical protein
MSLMSMLTGRTLRSTCGIQPNMSTMTGSSPRVIEELKKTNMRPVTPEEVRYDSAQTGSRFRLRHA